jgi:DNA-binding Lrp family transcriptional regulator
MGVLMPKAPKLDRMDLKILAALQVNGRITNAALSDEAGRFGKLSSHDRTG